MIRRLALSAVAVIALVACSPGTAPSGGLETFPATSPGVPLETTTPSTEPSTEPTTESMEPTTELPTESPEASG